MASAYTEAGHIRIIDLSSNPAETDNLAALCERAAWDENARVVLICFSPEVDEFLGTEFELGRPSIVDSVAELKQPVIAAIKGDAIGIGFELALACDIRIGSIQARFGLNQIHVGQIPSNGGTQRLPRLAGQAKAMQMILTGELINAEEACRTGILHRAVEPEDVVGTATQMAQEMVAKSPISLSYAKEALYSGRDLSLDQGLKMELDLYLLLFSTFDRTEGVQAFRTKRKPEFRGH